MAARKAFDDLDADQKAKAAKKAAKKAKFKPLGKVKITKAKGAKKKIKLKK